MKNLKLCVSGSLGGVIGDHLTQQPVNHIYLSYSIIRWFFGVEGEQVFGEMVVDFGKWGKFSF